MPKRSGKFYSKNEKELMQKLGLKPAPASGAGWIIKEDGENDDIMVQLKTTEASSYRITKMDLLKLESHSMVSNKIPMFLIQFIGSKSDRLYAVVELDNIPTVYKSLFGKQSHGKPKESIVAIQKEYESPTRERIKSGSKARNKFFEERDKQYGGRSHKS